MMLVCLECEGKHGVSRGGIKQWLEKQTCDRRGRWFKPPNGRLDLWRTTEGPLSKVAVAQWVKPVVYQSGGQWFDPQLLQSSCWSVLGQDIEPDFASDGSLNGVWVQVWIFISLDAPRMLASATSVWMCLQMNDCDLCCEVFWVAALLYKCSVFTYT